TVVRLPASPARAPADPAREERDQPDQRQHGRDDEQPVDREPDAEGDDGQQRQGDKKQHLVSLLSSAREVGRSREKTGPSASRLPLSSWSGYVHERSWGFSTQRIGGWVADRAKSAAVGLVLSAAALLGLVALARALPGWWPAPAAAAAALLVLLLSFVAPVVLE